MGPPPSTRRGAAGLLWLALLLVPGCQIAGTHVHNLQELHEDNGRHKRRAALMSDLEYFLRVGLVRGIPGLTTKDGYIEDVDNPLGECLKNLAGLDDIESSNPRVVALQAELFSRFAVEDPWNLSREVAVRGLGRIGAQLEVDMEPVTGEPATVEEVRDAIARLLNAARSTLDFGELDTTLPEEDLSAACAHIDAMVLDRDGALRLLRAGTVLEARTSRRDRRVAPLRETLVGLQKICVRESLRAALRDVPEEGVGGAYPGWNSPRVKAAAISACVQAFGDRALGDFIVQLRAGPPDEVTIAILNEVRRLGLPAPPEELTPEEGAARRELWIEAVLQQATDNANGTVRVAAMRALETISGGSVHSLREEDWLAWHRSR